MSLSVHQSGLGNYQTVDIATNLDEIMKVTHPLREVFDEYKHKLMDSIQHNGLDYSRGSLLSHFEPSQIAVIPRPGRSCG